MKYISLFSGIEAASVAWLPLGWEAMAFSEIEPFASAVLAYRFPDIPNVGDVTQHDWGQYRGRCDLVVGGPPCQAFSVAGLRQSLNDDRGNLSLAYVRAVRAIDPLWSLAENVPGWLSTKDNAFGCFLAALVGEDAPLVPTGGRWTDAGLVAGPERTAAWRILDAQYFGLAQRRRRVFVLSVRGSGNWACAAALFPLATSLSGDPSPRRQARQGTAPPLAHSLRAQSQLSHQDDRDTLVTHTLRSEGFDAREDGTGRGIPLVPNGQDAKIASCLTSREHKGPDSDCTSTLIPVLSHGAHGAHGAGIGRAGDPAFTLDTTSAMAVAFAENSRAELRLEGGDGQTTGALKTGGGKPGQSHPALCERKAVRRLTVAECEKLQGFPVGWTAIPMKKRNRAAEDAAMREYLKRTYQSLNDNEIGRLSPDGPRYKAIGNSKAVPVIRWIGERIEMVDRL